ncbi:MAG TPA: MFS transporter [Acidimicrobiales bacterium]|nr:MFS transporter [Acidimicrobiales bacterium]
MHVVVVEGRVSEGEHDGAAPQPAASGLRVLFDRNFWPYFTGNLVSNCGTWFQNLAQAILIFRLTHSTFAVGVVNFAQFVGTFVLVPWSGAAADRFDRRRLMVVMQVFSTAVTGVLALLTATGHTTAPVVVGLALLLGIATAFSVPAMQALVPLLVPVHELAGAIALNSVTFNLARAIGPVLGAFVIDRLSIAWAFGLNSLSYLVLVIALFVVHPRPQAARPAERPKLRESLRLVRDDAYLLALLMAVLALSLTADPVNTLTPGFVTQIFHRKDTLVGILVGAFGAGSVLAVFLAARIPDDVIRRLSRTLAVLGVGMLGFAVAPSMPFALIALVVGGFGFLASNTTATTALQLGVDDSQRGRLMALWSVAFLGVRPFGSLVDGAVATGAGLRPAAVLMAVPALAAGLVFVIRPIRRPDRAARA